MPDTISPAPTDLPLIEGAQAWYGTEMAARDDWSFTLTAADIAEIEAALDRVRTTDILAIDRAAFPLPRLSARLAEVGRDILDGRGFFLLRGLPVERYSLAEAARIFWGIGAHWGEPVSQNGKGHVLGHVKDLGLDYADPLARGYQTSARLPYHTDSSDLVGLLCLQTSKAGGLSSIVSTTTVYNEMVKRRPDLAAVLMQPLFRTRWGEVPEGRKPYYGTSPFNLTDGRLICSYVRSATRKAQLMDVVPRLTPQQIEAMDLFDELANDPALHLDMVLAPGDMQFVYNHNQLHDRTGFLDWPDPDKRRHLLRLWLSIPGDRALPEVFAQRYGSLEVGKRGGIITPQTRLHAPLIAI